MCEEADEACRLLSHALSCAPRKHKLAQCRDLLLLAQQLQDFEQVLLDLQVSPPTIKRPSNRSHPLPTTRDLAPKDMKEPHPSSTSSPSNSAHGDGLSKDHSLPHKQPLDSSPHNSQTHTPPTTTPPPSNSTAQHPSPSNSAYDDALSKDHSLKHKQPLDSSPHNSQTQTPPTTSPTPSNSTPQHLPPQTVRPDQTPPQATLNEASKADHARSFPDGTFPHGWVSTQRAAPICISSEDSDSDVEMVTFSQPVASQTVAEVPPQPSSNSVNLSPIPIMLTLSMDGSPPHTTFPVTSESPLTVSRVTPDSPPTPMSLNRSCSPPFAARVEPIYQPQPITLPQPPLPHRVEHTLPKIQELQNTLFPRLASHQSAQGRQLMRDTETSTKSNGQGKQEWKGGDIVEGSRPGDFVPRLCDRLGLGITKEHCGIMQRVADGIPHDKSKAVQSVAAASVYLVLRHLRPDHSMLAEVCRVAEVAPITIKTICAESTLDISTFMTKEA